MCATQLSHSIGITKCFWLWYAFQDIDYIYTTATSSQWNLVYVKCHAHIMIAYITKHITVPGKANVLTDSRIIIW